ncbi:ABC transporter permease [Clostridium sp. BJN0013]|uniref:ABC transporter permease n=1 Tax=Clostridium sp. BJN0013 TaxID=3236840 RepID=UPI0034C60BB4
MINFIYEELKRIVIKKKYMLIMIFLIIIIFGILMIRFIGSNEKNITKLESAIGYFKKAEVSTYDKDKKEYYKNQINVEQQILNNLKNQKKENYDETKVDNTINLLNKQLKSQNDDNINQQILKLQYYKEHDINKKNLMAEGMQNAIQILGILFPILLGFILTAVASDIISGEYSPNTIKLLITRPISRGKIIIGKICSLSIVSSVIVAISFIIISVECGIVYGFSDYKLPIMVGKRYVQDKSIVITEITSQMKYIKGSGELISNVSAIIIMALMLIIVSIALISFLVFISIVCKNSLSSALLSIGISIILESLMFYECGFDQVKHRIFIGALLQFFPYTFLNVGDTITGDLALKTNIPYMNVNYSITICVIWIIIMIISSVFIFKNKNID